MSRRTPLGPPLVIRNGTHRGEEGRESTSRARSSSSSRCLPARCGLIALRVETAVLRMATGGIPPRRVIWSTGREEEALRAHADVGEGLQQACRNRPLRVSCRTLGKEALDTGLEGTLEGLQIDEEVLLKRRQLEMGDEAKSATHSRARALCKRALLRRAGGSAHVRSFANARTHSFQRSPTHSRAQALRAHALCKRALLHHALTPAISSTSVPAPRRRDAATDTSEAEACETDTSVGAWAGGSESVWLEPALAETGALPSSACGSTALDSKEPSVAEDKFEMGRFR